MSDTQHPPLNVRHDKRLCALTGECVTVAPKVFWFEGDELLVEAHPGEEQREAVERAVELCPMAAISTES